MVSLKLNQVNASVNGDYISSTEQEFSVNNGITRKCVIRMCCKPYKRNDKKKLCEFDKINLKISTN